MPYSSMGSVPANLKKMDGIPLTLAQVNWIARIADGIPEGQVDNPWAVAKAKFKKSFTKKDGKWVSKKDKGTDVEKGFVVVGDNLYFTLDGENWSTADEAFDGMAVISKENGRYRIETVSTAALKDREGETFGTDAMDYDIAQAEVTGKYPEFRVFHKSFLAIGKVEKMRRVGIFAIDEGTSYDDPFSLEVCEKMLAENDGTWKVSRGFKVLEASGLCPECGEGLVIRVKHMVAGFRCPCCKSVHLGYKRVLKDIRFRRTRTFDVTVTDVPAVPWTSAAAFPISSESKEYAMTKFAEISGKIKTLKDAREILHSEYTQSDFHKKKEAHPHETVPSSPEDEEIYKLLTAIQQLDSHIKKLQDKQFKILKKKE